MVDGLGRLLRKIKRQLAYCMTVFLCLTPFVNAEELKARMALEEEISALEKQTVESLAKAFAEDQGLQALASSYSEAETFEDRMNTYTAIAVYVEITLVPKTPSPPPAQKEALKKFNERNTQLEELYRRYNTKD